MPVWITHSNKVKIRKVFPGFLAISVGIGVALFFGNAVPRQVIVEPDQRTCLVTSNELETVVRLRLSANADVVVTHVETNCNCTVISELPLEMKKGQVAEIPATVDLSEMPLPGRILFRFFTNPPIEVPVVKVELKLDESNACEQ